MVHFKILRTQPILYKHMQHLNQLTEEFTEEGLWKFLTSINKTFSITPYINNGLTRPRIADLLTSCTNLLLVGV